LNNIQTPVDIADYRQDQPRMYRNLPVSKPASFQDSRKLFGNPASWCMGFTLMVTPAAIGLVCIHTSELF
jgi:hypothetical protein